MRRLVGDVLRYGIVGVSSSGIDFLAYLGFTRTLHVPELYANLLAYLAGHLVSFFGNRKWTFRSQGELRKEYIRFWAVNLIGLGVSQGVLASGLTLGFHDIQAKVAAVLLAGLCNFTLNRIWTFRGR